MESMFNDSSDNISIAHLRSATSGASSIPNPHPWIFEGDSTYSFVHNGGASKDLLYDLITENGLDAGGAGVELLKLGIEEVYLLKDGLISWQEESLPLVK